MSDTLTVIKTENHEQKFASNDDCQKFYTVQVELFEESGEQRSCGWVQFKSFSGSLNLLEATGGLDDDDNMDGEAHTVPTDIYDEIMEWAEEVGY